MLLNDISMTAVFLVLFKVQPYSSSISMDISVVQLFTSHAAHACSMLITITNHALTLHKSFTSAIYA